MTDLIKSNENWFDLCDYEENEDEDYDKNKSRIIMTKFKDRIEGHTVMCYNYLKHDDSRNKNDRNPTGKALKINECDELAVIDVDIKRDIDKTRTKIVQKLKPHDIIVKTCSGGLHIYCNKGDFKPASNRMIKIYKCDDYDIDIMCTKDSSKRSLVVLPGSKVRTTHKSNQDVSPSMDKQNENQNVQTSPDNNASPSPDNQNVQTSPDNNASPSNESNNVPSNNNSAKINLQNEKTRLIGTYSFVQGSYDAYIIRDVNDILQDLEISIPEQEMKEATQAPGPMIPMREIKRENRLQQEPDTIISNELTEAIVNGLFDLEIHNDGGSRPIDKEITLFTLFPALNSLNRLYIDEAYDNVFNKCKLTLNAQCNFLKMKERYSNRETSPYLLIKMYKIWKPDYYEEYIKPIIDHEEPKINFIDLLDDFCMVDIKKKCENGEYTCDKEVIQDLSRVIRYVVGTDNMFLLKYYDSKRNRYTMGFVNDSTMQMYMRKCRAWRVGKKIMTIADIFNQNESKLTVKGVAFNSTDPSVFSIFQGFKFPILEKYNYDKITNFLTFMREVIADSNIEVYNYLLNWISFIVQHPGEKTKTAIVLKGLQGIGKGTFTDTICEMLAGYSASNVTDISELTGTFNSVVENKMLIVLNELKNCGDERGANFNSLKSIITEHDIRINEKNQPRRDGDNVANFIFVTNNAYPVKIESGDRRYLVLKVSGKYKGNYDYFQNLIKIRKEEDFYPNLLTFFIKRNISDFLPAKIPMTDAKQDIIRASLSVMEDWICRHYVQLLEGMPCTEARLNKPCEIKESSFNLMINEKCEHTRRTINKKQIYVYKLKEECIPLYSQIADTLRSENDYVGSLDESIL